MENNPSSGRLNFVPKAGRGVVRAVPAMALGHPAPAQVKAGSGGDTVIQMFNDAPPTTTIHWGGAGVPQVQSLYLFFWGSAWKSNPPPNPSAQDLYSDFAKILASPYLSRLRQYYFAQ